MTYAVQIENISRKFKRSKQEFYALKDVSFNIKEGEIFGLLGPNGSGKTTLINILTMVLKPSSGTAKIFDHDILKDKTKIVSIINSASGESQFHTFLTVKENLEFFATVYGLNKEQTKDKLEFLIKKLQIENILNLRFGWLSSGQRMRAILAKSLINDPKLQPSLS